MERTPVLVVGGFLGSGKTTLVRHLLLDAQARGRRLAVVSNEFGELGIDAALLGNAAGRMVELAGGCVCCQLSDELVDTLVELHETVQPDCIVIECSGVALPFDTQLHLYRPEVRAWLGDEACVVVVDAERAHETDPLFAEQLQSADLVVLNKCDLVDGDGLRAARARVAETAPDAPIVEAVRGNVPPDLLFPQGPLAGAAVRPAADDGSAHGHPHDHAHHGEWVSLELSVPAGRPESEVEASIHAEGALRAKGFVETAEGLRVLQGVGRRIEFSEPDGPVDPHLVGRVVVIRRG
jgi:cobalamin biosynthesis protein CobW